MDRRNLLIAFVGVFSLSSGYLIAKDHDNGKGKGRKDKDKEKDGGEEGGQDSRYFRREDHVAVQRYYNGPSNLPPGLRKKYYRTGQLPPGWQKKIRPFPPELIRELPPPPPNCDRGYIDGVAVVYDRRTRVILDVVDIVGALTGR